MTFKFNEITFENIVDNERHYIFNCNGDSKEITMTLKEEE